MSKQSAVLSLRLPAEERSRLERLARRMGRTVGELAARMVIEGRRREDFAWIDFRPTPTGRLAYVQGTRQPVWWVANVARQFKEDPMKVAKHLDLAPALVKAALNYATAFRDEIDAEIRDYEEITVEDLKRQLPNLEIFDVREESPRRSRK
jgi:uncharacterized protein (DUF433 family)